LLRLQKTPILFCAIEESDVMPIRITDPFKDPTLNLRTEVNPFLGKMQDALDGSSALPILYGPALQPWAKRWRNWFLEVNQLTAHEIIVEIGCHKGDVLKSMACNHPEKGFIGLDITFKRVVNTASKALQHQLSNIVSLLCNARALDQVFGAQEIDGFIIFFPDPWVRKKRQQKNRLLDLDFFQQMLSCLKPGGFVWVKTDHEPYFVDISTLAAQVGLLQSNEQASNITMESYTSRFEQHFRETGEPTFSGCWQKKTPPDNQAITDLVSSTASHQNG